MSKRRIDRRAFVRAVGTAAGVSGASTALAADDAPAPPTDIPTGTLSDLHHAVAGVLKARSVGTPVFARYSLELPGKDRALRGTVVHIASVVRGWLDQELVRVFATQSADVELSLLLEFAGGATALLTAVHRPAGHGAVDLMLLGNHGAIYHESGPIGIDLSEGKPDPTLVAAIERSLRSGKSERREAP